MADEKWLDDLKEDIIIIKETLKNMVATNELKLNAYDLKLKAIDEKLKVANNRIKDLEDSSTWLWRAVVAALISAASALLFKLK